MTIANQLDGVILAREELLNSPAELVARVAEEGDSPAPVLAEEGIAATGGQHCSRAGAQMEEAGEEMEGRPRSLAELEAVEEEHHSSWEADAVRMEYSVAAAQVASESRMQHK